MATKAEWVTTLKEENSSLTRLVNGIRETLSTAEYEATIDDWATSNAASDVRVVLEASGGESPDYVSFRTAPLGAGSYPSIPDQLDKLYHDIDDEKFGADAKTGTWYVAIKATKDKFPKPS
jgi:hypothetical protein